MLIFRLNLPCLLRRCCLCFMLLVFSLGTVHAHPFGGVIQRTLISDMSNSVLIEYFTHFGPELLFSLHPDKDFNGTLSENEQAEFLSRAHGLLFPNFSCTIGETVVELEEVERGLELEEEEDFKAGINTRFVFHLSLQEVESETSKILRIVDNNFKNNELNQLTYVVNVLGDIGPLKLRGEGRELQVDLSYGSRTLSENSEVLHASEQLSKTEKDHVEAETTSLIAFLKDEQRSFRLYLIGFVTAFVLGALHALSPGHGKAMVAAYLVGTRGRIVDAVRLGVVVTITHVISVVGLGVVALVASHYTLSKDIYPWLGVVSGTIIFLTGYFLLARTALAVGHHHHHHDHSHHHTTENNHSMKEIISLGVAGGLVPCPSAIVILLFAVAVNRIAAGLMLILSFSLGLAAVLILIGIFTITASHKLEKIGAGVSWIRRLPVFTAGIIMILGVAIGIHSLLEAGILTFTL